VPLRSQCIGGRHLIATATAVGALNHDADTASSGGPALLSRTSFRPSTFVWTMAGPLYACPQPRPRYLAIPSNLAVTAYGGVSQ
jgi:hypothetical protein